jgi:hypothetical protein
MVGAKFIGGDWGTTHLRLFLCGHELKALDQLDGPGANRVCGAFEKALDSLIRPWTDRHGDLPIVLSGMVGSSIGWVRTPYLPCPVEPEQIAGACIALRGGRIHIVPGLSCRNALAAPDIRLERLHVLDEGMFLIVRQIRTERMPVILNEIRRLILRQQKRQECSQILVIRSLVIERMNQPEQQVRMVRELVQGL